MTENYTLLPVHNEPDSLELEGELAAGDLNNNIPGGGKGLRVESWKCEDVSLSPQYWFMGCKKLQ